MVLLVWFWWILYLKFLLLLHKKWGSIGFVFITIVVFRKWCLLYSYCILFKLIILFSLLLTLWLLFSAYRALNLKPFLNIILWDSRGFLEKKGQLKNITANSVNHNTTPWNSRTIQYNIAIYHNTIVYLSLNSVMATVQNSKKFKQKYVSEWVRW